MNMATIEDSTAVNLKDSYRGSTIRDRVPKKRNLRMGNQLYYYIYIHTDITAVHTFHHTDNTKNKKSIQQTQHNYIKSMQTSKQTNDEAQRNLQERQNRNFVSIFLKNTLNFTANVTSSSSNFCKTHNSTHLNTLATHTHSMSFIKQLIFGYSEDPTGLTGPPSQENAPDPLVEGIFYPRTLYKFNGHDDERIFIAIRGRVFDCTTGRSFYGPSGPYANFAGKDASRGLALNSYEMDVIRDWNQPIDKLHGLNRKQRKALKEWLNFFDRKYPVVGTLVSEPEVNDPVEDSASEEEEDDDDDDDDESSSSSSESSSGSSESSSGSGSGSDTDDSGSESSGSESESESESENEDNSHHDVEERDKENETNEQSPAVQFNNNDVE